MTYLFIALLVGAIAFVPAAIIRKSWATAVACCLYVLVTWWVLYGNADGFAGPMFGSALFLLLVGSVIAAVVSCQDDDTVVVGLRDVVFPVGLALLFIGVLFSGSEFLNASEYRALIGDMEKRVWTQDVQPKDPQHVRLVSRENALYLSKKVVGELGTVGSQFEVQEESITLQAIKGELWYVVPLDFAGWRAWNNAETAVGYVMIHAEDPNHQPVVKHLDKTKQFAYTPGAWFGHDLIRHIRMNGYFRVDLNGTHLEIDEEGNPWWITAISKPSIGQFGDKVTGVVITNPVTGEIRFAPLGEVPQWVDRVMPASFVEDYLNYWGEYVHGWWAAFSSRLDLTEPEDPSLIYGSAHDPMFVSGITSRNTKDDSLIGVVYTHTRTGKSVIYEVKGGATDNAVMSAVSKFQDVQFKHLHPAAPQLYNLYGTMASVVPLVNENHAYSGVAVVNINNVQQVAIGRSLSEAVRQYQRLLGSGGDLASLSKERQTAVVEGVITRVKQDITQNGSAYYLVIEGVHHAFVGGSGEFPVLPLAQVGDRVKIEYFASGESILPMHTFNNLTLVLEKTKGEESVGQRQMESREANEDKPVRRTVEERIRNATPEELRKLDDVLKK